VTPNDAAGRVSRIDEILDRLRAPAPSPGRMPVEPEYLRGIRREISVTDPPPIESMARPSLVSARRTMIERMREYLSADDTQGALLVNALPGVGKTTAAVQVVEEMASSGQRVLYCGPRHNFYGDVLAMAEHPELWYEWLPRQDDTGHGGVETCQHAHWINEWLAKGFPGISFCKQICGWEYLNDACPYYAQKKKAGACVFGQHQHATSGHPLAASSSALVIDEFPLGAFCSEWHIPGRYVLPSGMDPTEALTECVAYLAAAASDGYVMEGKALLDTIGGAECVKAACDDFYVLSGDVQAPELFTAADVKRVGYNHLPSLIALLYREASASIEREDAYVHRLLIADGDLVLIQKRELSDGMPDKVVCLDATANTRLYEALLGREVEVVDAQPVSQGTVLQLYDRANGKSTFTDKTGEATPKVNQTEQVVQHIIDAEKYKQPAVISYQNMFEHSEVFAQMDHTHYYAARGTNAFQDADALFVIGTPQPPLPSIERQARAIFFDRMEPFRTTWSSPERRYQYVDEQGMGRAYPCSGFWGDEDLNAVLWSLREAEIIQAAHRARPLLHPVDIWLLTNIPLDELPPDRLLSFADIFSAPERVNPFKWDEVLTAVAEIDERQGYVTIKDIMACTSVSKDTAYAYWKMLLASGKWEKLPPSITQKRGRGRPAARMSHV